MFLCATFVEAARDLKRTTYQPIDRAEIENVTNLFNAFWLLRRTERHESDLYDMGPAGPIDLPVIPPLTRHSPSLGVEI